MIVSISRSAKTEARAPRIVSVCYWLARLQRQYRGSDTFFLSTRDAGEIGGKSAVTAGKWFKRAQDDGLLELVKAASLKARRAQKFRFVLSKVKLDGGPTRP